MGAVRAHPPAQVQAVHVGQHQGGGDQVEAIFLHAGDRFLPRSAMGDAGVGHFLFHHTGHDGPGELRTIDHEDAGQALIHVCKGRLVPGRPARAAPCYRRSSRQP